MELDRLQEDIRYTEVALFEMSTSLRRYHLWIGGISAISATASAASLLASVPAVTASLALLAAMLTALQTFLKSEERAVLCLNSGRQLGALRVRCRQTQNLVLAEGGSTTAEAATELVARLASDKAVLEQDAPAINPRAFNRARKKIRRKELYVHDTTGD